MIRIGKDGDDDEDGRWFGLWITDKSTGTETKVAALKFPLSGGSQPTIQARSDVFGSLIAITGGTAINSTNIPVLEAAVGLPDDSVGDPPTEATVSYSLLGRGITNANVSYNEATGKIIMRVGGSTSRSTPAGTTLTGLETPQLTASAQGAPASHDGQSAFTFELQFSGEFSLSYRTLRDSAFTVSGGDVVGARRLDPQQCPMGDNSRTGRQRGYYHSVARHFGLLCEWRYLHRRRQPALRTAGDYSPRTRRIGNRRNGHIIDPSEARGSTRAFN